MSKRQDLTAEALQGFRGEPLQYLYSSPSWFAYQVGAYFQRTGRPAPSDVRMGRGYQIRVRDMVFAFVGPKQDEVMRLS